MNIDFHRNNDRSADLINGFTRIYSCSIQEESQLILGLVYFYDDSFITTEAIINAASTIIVANYTFFVQQPTQNRTDVMETTSIMPATTSIVINSTATPSGSPGGLTGGQIAGITVGVVAVVAIVVTVIVVAIVVGMVVR